MEHSAWHDLIKKELPEGYFAQINHFMNEVYAQGVIYPPRDKVFNAIQTTPLDKVKVVIIGQDPYHGPKQAQGLSFSVPDLVPAPPSLQNILKELADDIGQKQSHDLTSWAKQGVLLLNASLTVPEHQANAHANGIWEPFTDAVIHHIIESPHHSPLYAHRGFFGSKPFSQTNHFLVAQGLEPIDWLK